ncbi:MAG: ATP phosphoribosyltransferase regulatory subunit, partial [Lachnospiraceae bacterium]|nr:ATP phosphoribosyltransferase regulatory subunit [Lachnospiraceae bacterium]
NIIAEIELILATTTLLGRLDFNNFTIRINDRRILKAMAAYSGFSEDDYDTVFIILDKMDKIGLDGVREELNQEGYDKSAVDTYLDLFDKVTNDIEGVKFLKETLKDVLDGEIADNLETIITSVDKTKTANFKMSFDPTLVRGMSYYTGPIFEISMDEFGGSVGGGGRYDEMIGRFTGNATPACGFSIGFERIIMLLLEREFKVPHKAGRTAYLIEKNMPQDKLADILEKAKTAREAGEQINVVIMKKNKKFQKEQLAAEGYDNIVEFFSREEQ